MRRLILLLAAAFFAAPAFGGTTFYSGNLRTNGNITSCGSGCTLATSDPDSAWAQWVGYSVSFKLTAPVAVSAITYGFGGGTSASGAVVPAGGFEPYLSLFDSSGNFLASTYSGTTCPAGAGSVGGNCYDVKLDAGTLSPGTYTLVVTAFENMSLAENYGSGNLSDGLTGLGNLGSSENLNYAFDLSIADHSATLLSPVPGSTLNTSALTFSWSAGTGVTAYLLSIGDLYKGSSNLYTSGTLRNITSASVTGLPISGENLYARLCSYIGSAWQCSDYIYFMSGAPTLAALTSPAPGTELSSSSATFQWSAGSGVTNYILQLGTTGPGSKDLYNGLSTTATQASVTGLPVSGATIYARLYSHFNGSWANHVDYVYNPPMAAALTSPTAGATLAATGQTFTWAPEAGATGYSLYLGTTGVGSGNLLDVHTTNTSVTTGSLPTNGETIYVRLWTNLNGTWKYNDYTFTAAAPATLTSPASATITATGQTFTWTPVTGATGYTLFLGSTGVGSGNLLDTHTTASSVTSGKLPAGTIYARLWTNFNGTWKYNDYTFTAQ